MKLVIMGTLLVLFQAPASIPPHAISTSNNVTKQREQNKSESTPVIIQSPQNPTSTQRDGGNESSENKQTHVVVDQASGKDFWDKFYYCSTFALVLVGALSLWLIWNQSKQTARSARATEDSVRLQETGMRQWLVIQNWQLRKENSADLRLRITCDIVNPTPYPLTLESWKATIGGFSLTEKNRALLPPQIPHLITLPMEITGREKIDHYLKESLVITVVGYITFEDVLKVQQTQPFSQLCVCGRHTSEFHRFEGAPDQVV
jgi:hypothetical protein